MTRAIVTSFLLLASVGVLAEHRGSIDKVNSGITINAGDTADDVSTVNGGITIGDGAVVDEAETVNGGIRLGEGARARSVDTVNGGIRLGSKAVVSGDVETVNGGISMEADAEAEGEVSNVNGAIELERAHVRGRVSTVNGDVLIGDGSRVEGGILVEEPNCGWLGCWGSRRPPRIVIGAGAVVGGTLKFEQEVKLYVHDSAQIGPVEGATAERYSGSAPPRD
jgi:DUF4097 and DUF4098 domain-containing protein YvlB